MSCHLKNWEDIIPYLRFIALLKIDDFFAKKERQQNKVALVTMSVLLPEQAPTVITK